MVGRHIYVAFAAFIAFCGLVHLAEAAVAFWPAYRLVVLLDVLTAAVSWLAVYLLWRMPPWVMVAEGEEEASKARELAAILQTRTQALEAFNHTVCHDLNGPLRAMEGFAEALAQDYAGRVDPKMADYVVRIQAAAVRMRRLVSDLMRLADISREYTRAGWADFSLTEMAEEIVRHAKADPAHDRHEAAVEPGMTARGDPGLVRLLLQNLLDNAFKFTAFAERPAVRVGRASSGEFFVKDNGVGFDQAQAGLLFRPFSRLHARDFHGTGIGLTIAKRVADIHGGTVRAEGEPGGGATFYFTLPEASDVGDDKAPAAGRG